MEFGSQRSCELADKAKEKKVEFPRFCRFLEVDRRARRKEGIVYSSSRCGWGRGRFDNA